MKIIPRETRIIFYTCLYGVPIGIYLAYQGRITEGIIIAILSVVSGILLSYGIGKDLASKQEESNEQ